MHKKRFSLGIQGMMKRYEMSKDIKDLTGI